MDLAGTEDSREPVATFVMISYLCSLNGLAFRSLARSFVSSSTTTNIYSLSLHAVIFHLSCCSPGRSPAGNRKGKSKKAKKVKNKKSWSLSGK